jgi:phosphopantothenoylcysteine decarboxylase
MNTFMWTSPFTAAHVTTLYKLGVAVLPPIAKRLACGDAGVGAMAEPASIAEATRALLQTTQVSCAWFIMLYRKCALLLQTCGAR